MRTVHLLLVGAALAAPAIPRAAAVAQSRAGSAVVVPDYTLPILVHAQSDSGFTTIRINPNILGRLDPRLALFLVLQEEERARLAEQAATGMAMVASGSESADSARVELSLRADCAAASRLADKAPETLAAVVTFFKLAAADDDERPTNGERAQRMAICGRRTPSKRSA